ncbi:hypothetical protein DY000_02013777 [Brassica cretica]|uniref:Uncharacterized protein n=1 Tax=Brassica cretica TaxID=69181 RepID=A0ABQ7CRF3_BRACR|nr:hypothetical protein DY000_02013777 [Brassica cretica]
MKNGEMKQSKKLLEDIVGIAGNCLKVCPCHEVRVQVVDSDVQVSLLETFQQKKSIEVMNSQVSKGGISGILDKISQATPEESQCISWIRWYEAQFI